MLNERFSATAHLIAKSTVFIARIPTLGTLVPSGAIEPCLWFMEECSPAGTRFLLRIIDKRWFRTLVFMLEYFTIRGILLHYILRKRFLEDVAKDAIQNGVKQIVILGAGFDTLSLRLHKDYPDTIFIELDHPATQRVKKLTLEKRHLQGKNLLFLPADFTQQTIEKNLLSCRHYDRTKTTLFIAEGVLMYLSCEDVEKILNFILNESGKNSTFAFTFMEPQKNGRTNFKQPSLLVDLWLSIRKEVFKWGIPRQMLSEYLKSQGFLLKEIATPETFRNLYLTDEKLKDLYLMEGEYIATATKI